MATLHVIRRGMNLESILPTETSGWCLILHVSYQSDSGVATDLPVSVFIRPESLEARDAGGHVWRALAVNCHDNYLVIAGVAEPDAAVDPAVCLSVGLRDHLRVKLSPMQASELTGESEMDYDAFKYQLCSLMAKSSSKIDIYDHLVLSPQPPLKLQLTSDTQHAHNYWKFQLPVEGHILALLNHQ